MSATNTNFDRLAYNPLHFKRRKGGLHDVGLEIEGIIPSAGEIRLLGNRHKQCAYYRVGVDVCQTQMQKDKADNFLACKMSENFASVLFISPGICRLPCRPAFRLPVAAFLPTSLRTSAAVIVFCMAIGIPVSLAAITTHRRGIVDSVDLSQ